MMQVFISLILISMPVSTHLPVVRTLLTAKTCQKRKMMNYYVPDFQMDDDCALPAPSSTFFTRPKKSSSSMPEEEVMELLWQNGQVVMQSQTQRSVKKSPPPPSADRSTDAPTPREIQSSHHQQSNHLSMQEDEMASWLHYPLQEANFDHDFCADLLYPPSATTCVTTVNTAPPARSMIQHTDLLRPPVAAAARPPIPPARRAEGAVQNFPYFTRHNRGRAIGAGGELGTSATAGPSSLRSTVRESTVVDSCVTPATAIGSDARISETAVSSTAGGGASSGGDNTYGTMSGAGLEPTFSGGTVGKITEMMRRTTCDLTVTSSPGGSSSSAEPQTKNPPADDRKRKGREEDAECHSEDAELESAGTKKQDRGSSSIKRTRAAEVHNLSERRRRDRINEKMKALQELIPRCNKSDKASMLDEAIEYLKSLQLQVQVMSMGCSMVPMMFPGIQQYMPPMGMGMGMGMGMNRPMMPFHKMLAGAPLPNPAAAAHLGPRFPMPGFHIPPLPTPDSTRIQPVSQSGPMLGSIGVQNANQPRIPIFSDPYQQYLGMHQMQIPIPQNETMVPPTTSKPSTSRGAEDHSNHTSG